MDKLLVVCSDGKEAEAFAHIAQNWFDRVVLVEPYDGFRGFMREKPTHVVIFNCQANKGGIPELQAWKNIKIVIGDCALVRCGDEGENSPDYIKKPFAIRDLIARMEMVGKSA